MHSSWRNHFAKSLVVLSILVAIVFAAGPVSAQVSCSGVPAWTTGKAFSAGNLATYGGREFKCVQAHTSQVGWEPPNAPALWSDMGSCSGSATATATTAGPTPTPAGGPLGGNYSIIARHSGKAVVVQGASTTDGAAVIQWPYGGAATNDEWVFASLGGGFYKVTNRNSGKALAVQGASTTDGAAVIQWTYGGTATNDEWSIADAGGGYSRLVNRNSGKVLDVTGASTADGAIVEQWTSTGGTNQQFQLVAVGSSTPAPTATATTPPSGGACLRTVNVATSSALSSAASGASPGDCIVVANGSYAGFTVTADGTSASPISIKAANRGGATISSGTVYLNGAHFVTVEGFVITTGGGSLSVDSTTRHAAVFFMNTNDSRLTRCTLRLGGTGSTSWVYLGGNSNRNRIDHDEFGPGSTKGYWVYPGGNVAISGVTAPARGTSGYESWARGGSPNNPNMARNTRIDHNYFHDKASGSGETLGLGALGVTGDYQNTSTVVEWNLFTNCDGDAEMITTKSSSNTIQNNTIRSSVGMISLRAGNGSKILNNIQIQGGKSGSAGIKIYEHNHTVTGNYVDGPADYALLIGAGDAYATPGFAHAPCENCVMDGNIAINLNVRAAIIGHGGSGAAPVGCTFRNNQLRGSVSPLINLSNEGNTVVSGNTISGGNPPLPRAPLTTSEVGPNAP